MPYVWIQMVIILPILMQTPIIDGEIQVSEAEAVLWLNVSERDILSLVGIESFTNLEYLDCFHNELIGNLDLTQNMNLKYLNIGINH